MALAIGTNGPLGQNRSDLTPQAGSTRPESAISMSRTSFVDEPEESSPRTSFPWVPRSGLPESQRAYGSEV